jgi:hypothetical protein
MKRFTLRNFGITYGYSFFYKNGHASFWAAHISPDSTAASAGPAIGAAACGCTVRLMPRPRRRWPVARAMLGISDGLRTRAGRTVALGARAMHHGRLADESPHVGLTPP